MVAVMERGCIIEYNDSDQVVYSKDLKSGFEVWKKYNEFGKLSKTKDSLGFETLYQYNSNGNLSCKVSLMYNRILKETKYTYDDKDQLVYLEDTNGFKAWYEYDENGNEISYRNSNGFKERD